MRPHAVTLRADRTSLMNLIWEEGETGITVGVVGSTRCPALSRQRTPGRPGGAAVHYLYINHFGAMAPPCHGREPRSSLTPLKITRTSVCIAQPIPHTQQCHSEPSRTSVLSRGPGQAHVKATTTYSRLRREQHEVPRMISMAERP